MALIGIITMTPVKGQGQHPRVSSGTDAFVNEKIPQSSLLCFLFQLRLGLHLAKTKLKAVRLFEWIHVSSFEQLWWLTIVDLVSKAEEIPGIIAGKKRRMACWHFMFKREFGGIFFITYNTSLRHDVFM